MWLFVVIIIIITIIITVIITIIIITIIVTIIITIIFFFYDYHFYLILNFHVKHKTSSCYYHQLPW